MLLKKKLKFSMFKNVYWSLIKNKIFLVIINRGSFDRYLSLSTKTNIYKVDREYFLFFSDYSTYFYGFMSKWNETLIKPLQKKLYFKGLGFKFRYFPTKDSLELKLGFSHLITITVPKKELRVFLIKKNRLAIEGFNYSLVTNFAHKLRSLRFPDSYNGKGFWYKNEFKVLKLVKKT